MDLVIRGYCPTLAGNPLAVVVVVLRRTRIVGSDCECGLLLLVRGRGWVLSLVVSTSGPLGHRRKIVPGHDPIVSDAGIGVDTDGHALARRSQVKMPPQVVNK